MENDTLRMPLIGERAPEFTAETTQGTIMFPSDYKGKWVILFSHPSDFTPVCTTEFMMFEKLRSELEKLNCALVGLSVGNVASHIAWLHSIREKIEYRGMRNVQVRFPLVADSTMEIARMYGMVSPSVSSTKAVRALFFIDPAGIVRATIYYPSTLGRNFDEIIRTLQGLQAVDRYGMALPADWRPGDDVVVMAADTYPAAEMRADDSGQDGMRCYDWYFCVKTWNSVVRPEQEREKIAETV